MIMVDTIERAIRPLFLVSFIFGFGILRHPLNRPRLHLSICYMLIVWSVYACAFYYVNVFFIPDLSVDLSGLKLFMTTVNWLITMTSIITTVCEYKKFWICIKKLGLVDHTLEELGTPKEYHRMRNSIKWALIIWLTMIFMTWTSTSFWYTKLFSDIRVIVLPLIINYSLYVNTWIDIMFAFILRHLHSELCRIAHDINCLFGLQMTLQMSSYFVALTEMFYFQYKMLLYIPQMDESSTRLTILWINMWLIIFLTKLISLNRICESVSVKAQNTKDEICKLTNLIRFTEAREEICQFVLQISLRPLRFNGMGLFYFGYNFIRKLCVSILAAIVGIVQMDSLISRMMTSGTNNKTIYN